MTPQTRSMLAGAISLVVFVVCVLSLDMMNPANTSSIGKQGGVVVLDSAAPPAPAVGSASAAAASASAGSATSDATGATSGAAGGSASGSTTSIQEVSTSTTKTPVEENEEAGDESHADSKWVVSSYQIATASVLAIMGVIIPLIIYAGFRLLELKREGEVESSQEPVSQEEGEIRLVDQRYALARDMRELISVPFGTVVFIQFLGMAVHVLGLPEWYDDMSVASMFNVFMTALLSLACLWTWFRTVDVTKLAVGRQQWVVQSKMFSMYHESASKVAFMAKFIGALIVCLVVALMWGNTSDFSSESLIASLSVAALGSLAFVGNMFRGTLQRYKAGLDMIGDNLLRTGDEIEIYGRAWGKVRGRVAYIESRFCIIVGADGKKIYVPTEYLPGSCLVNHSRSNLPINVDVHLSYTTPTDKIQEYQSDLREALVTHGAIIPESVHIVLRAFTPTSIIMQATVTSALTVPKDSVYEDVLLLAIQVASRLGVELAKPSPIPDLGLDSFSTN